MPRLYGLLVGIDTYPNPHHNLEGCVNDINSFASYLHHRTDGDGFDPPELKVLTNAEAKRQTVIDGFRKHLAQAKQGDVALFYYAGHGGQEHAPELFWGIEPDRLNETLVCWDSRTDGGWDLADKELSRLIAGVAENGPHVVVVLDCCHSGSGTRGPLVDDDLHATAVRRIPTDERRRPLEQYLFWNEIRGRDVAPDPNVWTLLPEGDHVLLAACQDNQLAKEYVADGRTYGVFSYFLRQILSEANRSLSYAELIARVRARVESHKPDQRPVLEVKRNTALKEIFLGGAVADHPTLLAYYDLNTQSWTLDAGAVHGIPEPEGNETTRLALFDVNTPPEVLSDPERAVAEATVRSVQPARSLLDPLDSSDLDPDAQYQAVVTALPLPPLPVRFEGDPAGVAAARQALTLAGPGGGASLYVREDEVSPRYRLLARDNEYVIAQTADDRPLVREIEGGYSDATAKKAVANLEHIARWHKIVDLANSSSRIDADAVELIYNDEPVADGSRTLHYAYENGAWKQPSFQLKLSNTGDERLYCALLDLSESYAVGASLLPGGGVWLEPGDTIDVYGGKPIPTSVPDALWERGITERKDVLKLIVSHAPFNAQLLHQNALDQPRLDRRTMRSARGGPGGTLERLMSRVQTRELGAAAEVDRYDDWTTKELVIFTVRPRSEVPVSSTGSAPLGFGVTVGAHPALQATARLTSEAEVGRGYQEQHLGALVAPDLFGQDPELSRPLVFTRARGQDPGLSVLELTDVRNHETVTAEQPLELTLEVDLADDEHLLPVAFDGEFFLPLGRVAPGTTRGGGQIRVVLERLPDPTGLEARSLGGSIRILFQKFIGKVFPSQYSYPLLAIAEVADDGEVHYEASPDRVREAVAGADRILLFIHGIIGDTKSLLAGAQLAKLYGDVPLKEHYDLLLAFDYENLDTPIDQTAAALKARLEAAGLAPGHGKTLEVVAHSMGGLVSRWYVEKLGGHEVVDHLVMLGTPNAGSPWSTVQDWATSATALVLNRFTTVFWPAQVLGGLLTLLERVDTALDQMRPDSAFLKQLAQIDRPSVRTTILAGNTELIASDPEAHRERTSRIGRLLARLKLKQRTYEALTATVFKEANDIAVTVNSIKKIRGVSRIREVASDHISYFSSAAGLDALAWGLAGETADAGADGSSKPPDPPSGGPGPTRSAAPRQGS